MRTVNAQIGFTLDGASVHACNYTNRDGKTQIRLTDGVYFWATADDLIALADKLLTVAVEMRQAARVVAAVFGEETSPGHVAAVNPLARAVEA
jgi:hypothetical protein